MTLRRGKSKHSIELSLREYSYILDIIGVEAKEQSYWS